MNRIVSISVLLPLVTAACHVSFADSVLKSEHRSLSASGVTRARFETGAGELKIEGRPGAASVEVSAEFRGPAGALEDLKLTTELQGSTFYLKAENASRWGASGRIDLVVTLPPALSIEVADGSGSMSLSRIDGDVRVEDGSGEIEVDSVRGKLSITDGSGSIRIRDAGSDVEIHDGSGGIDVAHVRGRLRIEDGSGGIDVRDIGGSLDVASKGSGSVRYDDVRGEVRVPHRKRRAE